MMLTTLCSISECNWDKFTLAYSSLMKLSFKKCLSGSSEDEKRYKEWENLTHGWEN